MISEGCGTEDWSNDAENSALITEINYILKCIQIEFFLFFFQLYKYFTLPFLSIKYSLGENETSFKNIQKL